MALQWRTEWSTGNLTECYEEVLPTPATFQTTAVSDFRLMAFRASHVFNQYWRVIIRCGVSIAFAKTLTRYGRRGSSTASAADTALILLC